MSVKNGANWRPKVHFCSKGHYIPILGNLAEAVFDSMNEKEWDEYIRKGFSFIVPSRFRSV